MPAGDRRSRRQRESDDPVARHLGERQARLMDVFWQRDGATVREVLAALDERQLAYTTVLTLVSRLWSRGLLEREADGRGYRYRAAKSREELMAEISDELIDRLIEDFGDVAVARLGARFRRASESAKLRLRELKGSE